MATRSGKQRPVASGASFDLWKVGNVEDDHIFAVKRLRVYESDDVRHMKKVIQIGDARGKGPVDWPGTLRWVLTTHYEI